MRKIYILTALLISTMSTFAATNYDFTPAAPVTPVYNQNNYVQENISGTGTLKGSVVTVPAGQNFAAVVTTPISSATLSLGQNVTMALGSDFYYGNNLIAPAGSSVTGSVIEVSKAKRGGINGRVLIRFTQVVTPYGVQIPISAVIKTDDNSGLLLGGTKMDVAKEYGKDLAIGSAAGALAGVIISPMAGGEVGKGTALATAVGAGGGLVKSIWDKGKDVEIPVNATVQLLLTQPITVNPNVYNRNY